MFLSTDDKSESPFTGSPVKLICSINYIMGSGFVKLV